MHTCVGGIAARMQERSKAEGKPCQKHGRGVDTWRNGICVIFMHAYNQTFVNTQRCIYAHAVMYPRTVFTEAAQLGSTWSIIDCDMYVPMHL